MAHQFGDGIYCSLRVASYMKWNDPMHPIGTSRSEIEFYVRSIDDAKVARSVDDELLTHDTWIYGEIISRKEHCIKTRTADTFNAERSSSNWMVFVLIVL
jgi:hypothetical protein